MNKEDKYSSRDSSIQRKLDSKRNHTIGRNPEEQHKRTRSWSWKKEWSSMRGQQSGIYERKIYVSKKNRRFESKFYKKIMNQQI